MKNLCILFTLLLAFSCFSQEIEFGEVSKQELKESFHPIDSTASAAFLYKKRRTYYRYDQSKGFILVTEIHKRIKIYNKEGFDKATFKISTYKNGGSKEKVSSIKGYSFNLEGNDIKKTKLKKEHRFKEAVSDNRDIIKIVFPDVKEGTIIDLKYTFNSPFATNIDQINFQYDIPVNESDITIEYPEYYNFKKASKGYYSIPVISTKKRGSITFNSKTRSGDNSFTPGKTSYQSSTIDFTNHVDKYKASNIPALSSNEPYVYNIQNYRGGITYELSSTKFPNSRLRYYTTSWEDVSKKIYSFKGFGNEIDKTGYYKEELNNLIAKTTSPVEKMGLIFNFIKSKVTWNGKYGKYTQEGVKKAYKNGSGNVADINLMLTSMLRQANLTANPVLVSSKANGIPLYPTLDGFNYVISIVEFSNGSYALLDATEPYSIPNVLPTRALNWNGRKVTKEGYSTWVNLKSPKHSLEENFMKAIIDTDGSVSGFLRRKEKMLNALLSRKRLNNINKEDIISKLEEKYNIEIEDLKITNQKKLGAPLNQMLKFTSDDLVEEINNKLYVNPFLFLTSSTNPFKSNVREFPVDYITPWQEANKISIQIPEGYKIESIPEKLAIGLPENLGFFKFVAIQQENTIRISSILQFNTSIIAPTYYNALKEFYSKIIAKQNEKIAFIKK